MLPKSGKVNRIEGETMADGDSVTRWLAGVKDGDGADIERVWSRYFSRLVRLAGTKLPAHGRRSFDEEDIALSAFQSFCDRANRGLFPQLDDRDDLWRLLATLTARKAIMAMRKQSRKKRGGGRLMGESGLAQPGHPESAGLAEFCKNEPTPQAAAEFADQLEHLLQKLDDATLKTIALRKLEGFTSAEIATELGVTARTVDRKLNVIRALWEEDV